MATTPATCRRRPSGPTTVPARWLSASPPAVPTGSGRRRSRGGGQPSDLNNPAGRYPAEKDVTTMRPKAIGIVLLLALTGTACAGDVVRYHSAPVAADGVTILAGDAAAGSGAGEVAASV